MVKVIKGTLQGFNEVRIQVQVPGAKEPTPVCMVALPLVWYLDEGETVIGKLLLNGKEVGAAVIRVIYGEGRQ